LGWAGGVVGGGALGFAGGEWRFLPSAATGVDAEGTTRQLGLSGAWERVGRSGLPGEIGASFRQRLRG
jgi:hypothetical protein